MNTFSFVLGGMLGILAAWAFFSASMKLHLAHERLEKLKKIEREIKEKKQEVKISQTSSRIETRQSFFLYILAVFITVAGGAILFTS